MPSDASVICRVAYLQFPVQSAFFPCLSARQHSGVRGLPNCQTSDVAKNLGRYLSCTDRIVQENNFELMLTVKMETRHLTERSFGSEFPAICNHCIVTTAWSRRTLKCCEEFLRFFGKTTSYAKIFKIMFRKFLSRHRSTLLCSNFVKFVRREIGAIVRYLPDKKKKISLASQTVATARIAPKICQSQYPTTYSECSRFHPNRSTFGGVIA